MTELPPRRVSDAEREAAVARLRDAHADGRLTLAELSERVDLAYAARTEPELERTTADLAPAGLPPAPSRKRPRRFVLAVFGGPTLTGRWRAARRLWSIAVFGGADIDLAQAQLAPEGLTIVSIAVFGGNDLYVPEGIEVDVTDFAIFGGSDRHGREPEPHPGAPLVRVISLAVFGGNDIHHVPAGGGGSVPRRPRGLPRPPELPRGPRLDRQHGRNHEED